MLGGLLVDGNKVVKFFFVIWGKLQRNLKHGHFPPAYLGGGNKLWAYLFFIYGLTLEKNIASIMILYFLLITLRNIFVVFTWTVNFPPWTLA